MLVWRHIDVSYNNETGFPSQIILLWVIVDIEVSKH